MSAFSFPISFILPIFPWLCTLNQLSYLIALLFCYLQNGENNKTFTTSIRMYNLGWQQHKYFSGVVPVVHCLGMNHTSPYPHQKAKNQKGISGLKQIYFAYTPVLWEELGGNNLCLLQSALVRVMGKLGTGSYKGSCTPLSGGSSQLLVGTSTENGLSMCLLSFLIAWNL